MRIASLVPLIALMGCAAPAAQGPVGFPSKSIAPAGPETAAATITAEEIYRRIEFLASDELGGRDTPSPGLDRAAEYVAREFERIGLRPAGDAGTFVQRYALQRRALDTDRVHLRADGPAGATSLAFGTDFVAFPGVPAEGRSGLVFAGTRIDPRTMTDVLRDRVAVVYLAGMPTTPDYSRAINSLRGGAAEAGAAGLIIVVDPEFPQSAITSLVGRVSGPSGLTVGELTDRPIFLVRYEAARRLLAGSGIDLDRFRTPGGEADFEPVSLEGITAEFGAPPRIISDDRAPNVVAVLPGSDPVLRDEYVVFSAHMDHVGIGRPNEAGDSIYNGADDNASGTAALLEVAEAFAAMPTPPARSLVFLAVSGEEKGLLGSYYYSEHPTVPLEQIVADINVDMIGRNAPDSIVVIGQEYSSLGPLVRQVAESRPELGLTVAPDLWPEQRFFFRSDHFNFARKEIPALFFFAGVHEDYHQASDEVEKIDADKTARVARLIFYTAHAIATQQVAPRWTEKGLQEVRALTGGGR